MSDYAFVADRAKKVFASVSRLENRLAERPSDRAVQINLSAMRKQALQVQEELERLAALNQMEICQYRIIPISENGYGLGRVSKSLLEYQNLFSQIYDAFKNGIKSKATFGADVIEESSLNFAYSYSGSLGVALLAQSNRDFFGGTLDKSIDALYQILDMDDPFAVRDAAKSLGTSVIKRVHDWSQANVEGGFSADIRWKRSDGRVLGQVIDKDHMERIVGFIDEASDKETKREIFEGMLVAVSLPRKTFQIVIPDGETYSGKFADGLNLPHEMTVGRFYSATIEIVEVFKYATQATMRTISLVNIKGPIMPKQA